MYLPDLLKVTVIKRQEILVLLFQSLDVVRNTFGEIPDVTGIKLLGRKAAVLVDSAEKKRSIVDKTPFGLHILVNIGMRMMCLGGIYRSVLVQLMDSSLFQVLLGTSDVMALGKILNDLLAGPATREEFCLGLGKAPLDVRYKSIIS